MRRSLASASALFLLALAAPAQAPSAGEPSADPDVALVEQAVGLLTSGDAAGAVALLEPVRQRSAPPRQLLALLGTSYLEAGRADDALALLAPLAEGEGADPAVLYNAGRAALAAGDLERGESFLERSLALQPNTPAARELGLLRGTQGRMRESYRLLRPWALANPDDREARLAAALAAIRLERLPEAEQLLEGLPTEDDRVRLLWGQIRLLSGDPRGAVATLAPILAEESGTVDLAVRRTMAEAQISLGQPEEAVSLLAGHVGEDPAATLVLGQAQYRAGDLDAGLATLQPFATRLLQVAGAAGGEMANQQLGARYGLEYGRMLAAAGRHEEALPHLQLATRLEPSNRQAWQQLGQTLAALDRRDEAAAALERFEALNREEGTLTAKRERFETETEDPAARAILKARELMADERYDEALEVLRAEIELAPEELRPRLLESRVLLVAGRPQEALDRGEEIVARFPENADAYYQRGTAHLALEHRTSAEADFRQALALAPDHVPAMSDLAVVLTVRGERTEAERQLERVLELRPDDARAKAHLERLRAGGKG
jgi:tetratricopeptide (TPR) repeat protein